MYNSEAENFRKKMFEDQKNERMRQTTDSYEIQKQNANQVNTPNSTKNQPEIPSPSYMYHNP
ncbi:MAG: hypothetical protein OEZ01_12890 [Candidatus Heimdallarchaeota archaeon]|nr:hypothetical protein [Candidatus Heimdallarchaeota archaeon]MDH5646903.1 hypothetical protein [Candidatus Heimdallarchaeota archaeon]